MIEVGALRALRAVAGLGTLARAAEELGFTASAVSQQLKRLERQVGVPVIAPAGRGVVLTPAGQAIVDSAPEVFQALERCAEAAQSVSEGTPRGVLRVVAFSTAIRGLLAPTLRALATTAPELQVHLTEQDPDQALRSVEAGAADLALVHDADGLPPPLPPSLTHRHIHTDVGDLVMSRTHPLAQYSGHALAMRAESSSAIPASQLRPLTAGDLAGQAWVTSPPGTVCHQWFRRLFADVPEEPDVRHLVDDFATQLALVEAGDVIALIPRLARPPLADGLVARPLQRRPTREVRAAWRRSADASPAIQAMLTELSRGRPAS
ncbi:LysR family transcriptional regulator [Kribbella ginsengisoli]|uniref:LysR family transcriptional regulator n=1 Tax=Kribbella ginsengisoli TaxID=363865 RepID=A0ABP6W254_9ACTN